MLLWLPLGSRPPGGSEIAQDSATWPIRCFGFKWYSDMSGARSIRDSDTGNEDDNSFAGLSNIVYFLKSVLSYLI